MIKENRVSKYIIYAIGEIVLVVIGILIALQVNNWNNERTDRTRETKYLENIKLDIQKDLLSLDYLINFRTKRIEGDQSLLAHIKGSPIEDVTLLTYYVCNTLMEERFSPNNNTYTELSSSGNLNLISNDTIKSLLLDLEELYKTNQFSIEHESHDYREYISKPLAKYVKIDQLMPVFLSAKTIEQQEISMEDFSELFGSAEYRNGLYIESLISEQMILIYNEIEENSNKLVDTIDKELETL